MNTQPSLRHQQASPAGTNPSVGNLSYSGPPHGTSSNGCGAAQDSTGSGGSNNYDTSKDNGSRADEVLHDMSNTSCAVTTTAPSQSGFIAINAPTMSSSGRPPQVQAQPLHTSHIAYDQIQARPHSLNSNQARASVSRELSSPATPAGHPSERAQEQAQQHTTSPTQDQNSHDSMPTVSRNDTTAAPGTFRQYDGVSPLEPSNVDTVQSSHSITRTPSSTPRSPALIVQPPQSGIPEPFTGSSTVAGPAATNGPWPEYQQQQAIGDAAYAGQERKDEELRKGKERVEDDERKQKEEEEETRQEQTAASQPKPGDKKVEEQQAPASVAAQSNTAKATEAPVDGPELEAEIRAMMAKMRELNSKNPQLLARIWEEERKVRTPRLPATTEPAPQSSVFPPPQEPVHPIANQSKKATPRKSPSVPSTKAAALVQNPAIQATVPVPAAAHVRTGRNTIWPAGKKHELAEAAADYLKLKNPNASIDAGQIFRILDGNPSYIQLCEQLEQMGLKLNRKTFARNLLIAVPTIQSASRDSTLKPISPALPPATERPMATSVASYSHYTSAAASPMNRSPFPSFPGNDVPAALAPASPIPVANMIPVKPGLKQPANKEEAARKRSLSDLIDLSHLDDDDMGPPTKRLNAHPMNAYGSPYLRINDAMDKGAAPVNNFPTASAALPQVGKLTSGKRPISMNELRYKAIVEPLDKKKALRRNTYNPATIARDVLLACGRHPYERQLNQHLDVLKANISQISNDSDLSTIKWDIIDPGEPPLGYFKSNL